MTTFTIAHLIALSNTKGCFENVQINQITTAINNNQVDATVQASTWFSVDQTDVEIDFETRICYPIVFQTDKYGHVAIRDLENKLLTYAINVCNPDNTLMTATQLHKIDTLIKMQSQTVTNTVTTILKHII